MKKSEPVRSFFVAGADCHGVPAQARIDGDRIVLTSPAAASPVAARYAWVGGDDLPLPPLRTDD